MTRQSKLQSHVIKETTLESRKTHNDAVTRARSTGKEVYYVAYWTVQGVKLLVVFAVGTTLASLLW